MSTEQPRVTHTEALTQGDKILVTVDSGRTYEMTVSYTFTDQSIAQANAFTVVAHIRPGGFSVDLRNDNLLKYNARWAS